MRSGRFGSKHSEGATETYPSSRPRDSLESDNRVTGRTLCSSWIEVLVLQDKHGHTHVLRTFPRLYLSTLLSRPNMSGFISSPVLQTFQPISVSTRVNVCDVGDSEVFFGDSSNLFGYSSYIYVIDQVRAKAIVVAAPIANPVIAPVCSRAPPRP